MGPLFDRTCLTCRIPPLFTYSFITVGHYTATASANNSFAPDRLRSIAISKSICLFVCLFVVPLAYLKNTSKFREIFCTFCLWPWLGSSLATVQYVMKFRHLFTLMGPVGQNHRRRCFFEFGRWRHRKRSCCL